MKATIFHNNKHINITISDPDITPEECRENLKTYLHYHHHLTTPQFNNQVTPYPMTFIKTTITSHIRTKLAQLSQQNTTLAKLPTYIQP